MVGCIMKCKKIVTASVLVEFGLKSELNERKSLNFIYIFSFIVVLAAILDIDDIYFRHMPIFRTKFTTETSFSSFFHRTKKKILAQNAGFFQNGRNLNLFFKS
jgi:hypothetical protein